MTDRSIFTLRDVTFDGIPISDVTIKIFTTAAAQVLGVKLWTALGGEDIDKILPVEGELVGYTDQGEFRGHAKLEVINGARTIPLTLSGRGQLSGIPQEEDALQPVGS